MRVLFLDVDGVMNSEETLKRRVHRYQGVVGIDPYLALLVNRIIHATNCVVVLSSAWRGSPEGETYIETAIGVKLHDRTIHAPAHFKEDGTFDRMALRGEEIQEWLDRHPEVERYAIIDDDSDMLESQRENFFQTSWKIGITEEHVEKIIHHLTR